MEMNFLTYFGIVSLYGNATERKMGWYNGTGETSSTSDLVWIRKYEARGFKIFGDSREVMEELGEEEEHECGISRYYTHSTRSLFDDGVYIYKLPKYAYSEHDTLLKGLEDWFVWRLVNPQCWEEDVDGMRSGFVLSSRDWLDLSNM